jgi:AcrR family transcriptional regulator
MATKDKILDAALVLFNTEGTGAVTTNHIADRAGLSVGNLYYHYKNKEEIIRAVYEQMAGEWDALYDLPSDVLPTVADLERLLSGNYEILWRYRFFYRELIALNRRDPILAERFQAVRARGFADFTHLFAVFVESGIFRPVSDPCELEELTRLCWMVSEFWMAFVELGGETVDLPRHQSEGVALLRRVLVPYLRTTPEES